MYCINDGKIYLIISLNHGWSVMLLYGDKTYKPPILDKIKIFNWYPGCLLLYSQRQFIILGTDQLGTDNGSSNWECSKIYGSLHTLCIQWNFFHIGESKFIIRFIK